MNPAKPLELFPLLRTRNLDEMRAALAYIYAAPKIDIVGDSRGLRAVINHRALHDVELSYASYQANFRMHFPETDFVSQLFPVRGEGEVQVAGTSFVVDQRRSVVISADQAFDLASNADYQRLVLKASAAAMAGKLAALTGVEPTRPLAFHPVQDGVDPAAKALRRHFFFLVDRIGAGEPLPDLMVKEFEQLLLVMFLHANRHNYSHLLQGKPPDAAPYHVRRAEEYIEANWMKPISLEALAAAADVSIRSLQRSFRKSRGCSPSAFLQQIRLRHARLLLQEAAATSLKEVALICGFRGVAQFSAAYVRAFGERPADARGRGEGVAPRLH